MPTIKNMSYEPISIELADSTITLGPRESKNIEKADVDSPDIQKYLREDRLFVIPTADAVAEKVSDAPVEKKEKPAKPTQ
jgi:hypothetical protein